MCFVAWLHVHALQEYCACVTSKFITVHILMLLCADTVRADGECCCNTYMKAMTKTCGSTSRIEATSPHHRLSETNSTHESANAMRTQQHRPLLSPPWQTALHCIIFSRFLFQEKHKSKLYLNEKVRILKLHVQQYCSVRLRNPTKRWNIFILLALLDLALGNLSPPYQLFLWTCSVRVWLYFIYSFCVCGKWTLFSKWL